MRARAYGESGLGQPLTYLTHGSGRHTILITSGMHGDEAEGVVLGSMVWAELVKRPSATRFCWIPLYNPDGFALGQRWSSSRVDLNRNFPTAHWRAKASNPRYPPGPRPASEPETRAFVKLISKLRPDLHLDLHSFQKTAVLLDFATSFARLDRMARVLARELGVPARRGGLGYDEFGCAFQWMAEHGIPSLTLEVRRDLGRARVKERYLRPTLNFLWECARGKITG